MYNGTIIKVLLEESGHKAKELLMALGLDPNRNSVMQIVKGNPSVSRIEEIANFFNVPVDVFFERDYAIDMNLLVNRTYIKQIGLANLLNVSKSEEFDVSKMEYLQAEIVRLQEYISTLESDKEFLKRQVDALVCGRNSDEVSDNLKAM